MGNKDFPEQVVRTVFGILKGRCECTGCAGHKGPCTARFTYDQRATPDKPNGWCADPIRKDGGNDHGNCRILCAPCHASSRGRR